MYIYLLLSEKLNLKKSEEKIGRFNNTHTQYKNKVFGALFQSIIT